MNYLMLTFFVYKCVHAYMCVCVYTYVFEELLLQALRRKEFLKGVLVSCEFLFKSLMSSLSVLLQKVRLWSQARLEALCFALLCISSVSMDQKKQKQ